MVGIPTPPAVDHLPLPDQVKRLHFHIATLTTELRRAHAQTQKAYKDRAEIHARLRSKQLPPVE